MLLVVFPLLLLSLPTWLQVRFTFRHLPYHSAGYLWGVFSLALVGQVLAGVLATLVSLKGFVQQEEMCATGAEIFLFGGVVLATTVTPGLALLAASRRWWQSSI